MYIRESTRAVYTNYEKEVQFVQRTKALQKSGLYEALPKLLFE